MSDLGLQVLRTRPRSGSSGLETKTETLVIRSRDWDLDKMNSSLETMVSKSHHWLHQFQLVTEHSLKGATNYGNRATGVGTKHAVLRLRPRLRPWSSGLKTKAETWVFRSQDQDRDLDFRSQDQAETSVYRSQAKTKTLAITRVNGLKITSLHNIAPGSPHQCVAD